MFTREKLRRWFVHLPKRLWAMLAVLATLCLVLAALYLSTDIIYITSSLGVNTTVLATRFSNATALGAASIDLEEEDILVADTLPSGETWLHVEHAVDVTLTADGITQILAVPPGTVAQALAHCGIEVGPDDYTLPSLDSRISEGRNTEISLYRVKYETYQVDEVIPYETEYQYTSLFYRTPDFELVIQQGADGYCRAVMQDMYVNGELVQTVQLEDEGSIEPITHIVKKYGEGVPVSSLEPPEGITVEDHVPSSYSEVYTMRATGYSAKRGRGASGLGLYYGTFAVDPTLIPYGTKVYIVSEDKRFVYGWAIATDTGGFIHHTRLQVDLFYETYAESVKNAVQTVLVYVPSSDSEP